MGVAPAPAPGAGPRSGSAAPAEPGAAAVRGYSIVLPPGWRRIPVRSGAEKAVRAAVREAFSVLPRDAPPDRVGPRRMELERRLMNMVREVRGKGGIDLCLPVLPVYGSPLPASFLVSELFLAPSAGTDVAAASIMALLAATEIATQTATGTAGTGEHAVAHPVTVDGAGGLRMERTAGPLPARDVEHGSRRVDYVLPVPGDPARWLAIVFSTLGGGDPEDQVAVLLTSLFDAMMSTFRWGRTHR